MLPIHQSSNWLYLDPLPQASIEGQAQFEEMAIPREMEGETAAGLRLIAQEKAKSAALSGQLSSVTDEEIMEFLDVLDELDFQRAPVLLNPKLPLIALETLRRGLLSEQHGQTQVATVLNFWSALQYHQNPHDLETISIFDPRAAIMIKEKLTLCPDKNHFFARFLQNIQTLPLSEQRFLLVPDIQTEPSPDGNPYEDTTISQVITEIGFSLFNRVHCNGVPMRMVPSLGMMQTALITLYGNSAVTIKPRLYLSTLRHVYHTRVTSTCDMMVPTPCADGTSRCPAKADSYPAPGYDFSFHDFYHATVCSSIGPVYTKVGILASDVLRSLAQQSPAEDQKGLHQLAVSCLDMEFAGFLKNDIQWSKDPSVPAGALWGTILEKIQTHKTQLEAKKVLEAKGMVFPLKVDPISEEGEVHIFTSLYQTFEFYQHSQTFLPLNILCTTFRGLGPIFHRADPHNPLSRAWVALFHVPTEPSVEEFDVD